MLAARIADRALPKLVPKIDAGACVPDHGEICGTYRRYTVCDSQGKWWASYWQKRVGCNGSCYWSSYAYRVRVGSCIT